MFTQSRIAPRSWGNFRVFSPVSQDVKDKKLIFAYFAFFDVYAIKNRPAQLGRPLLFVISPAEVINILLKKSLSYLVV